MVTPVSWPSNNWAPMAGKYRVQPVSTQSRSPYTGSLKSLKLAQIWQVDLEWNNHSLGDTFQLQAFLESLDGPSTPVRLFDWWRRRPWLVDQAATEPWSDLTLFTDGTGWGSISIAPTVKYAYERGAQIMVIEDLPVSAAALVPGDLFEIPNLDLTQQGFLHTVMKNVNADAAGESSISFKPGLRADVAIGTGLRLFNPRGTFRMTSDPDIINRMFRAGTGFSLSFAEDVP